MFRKLRIAVLGFVLLNVMLGAWLARARSTDWDQPLNVVVYAINGDRSSVSASYIEAMESLDYEGREAFFADIEAFFEREAARHGLELTKPVEIRYAGTLEAQPPMPPRGGSTLSIMLWSLKLRYWAWQHDDYPYAQDVVIFVRYFDPDRSPVLAHSLGLQKGLLGVVNAFAVKRMREENHIVIAHELLHTVGATDKYDPVTTLPRHPDGYADPFLDPLHPQTDAEIMAGRIALAADRAEQPEGFEDVVVGGATAIEIKWR